MKLKFSLLIAPIVISFSLHAESSQTISGRKGQFRLLSADINEAAAYHFVTSVQFFQDSNLLEDVDESTLRGTEATLAFGYALTPEIHLSAHGGFRQVIREPQINTGVGSPGAESIDIIRAGTAVTGTYDVGRFFKLPENKFTAGLSIWISLEKILRIIKAPDVRPTFIFSGDFSDYKLFPWRTHLNLGMRFSNDRRYFESDDTVVDLDRFATDTIRSPAIVAAWGFELPFGPITPSAEFHLHKVLNASFARSPKWVTVGLKGKPFPQKNIELIAGVDVGMTSFEASPTAVHPEVGPVPLWNAVMGFEISQFGRRAGEVGVDRREYESVRKNLSEREEMIAGLRRDLEFNTIQGTVIDAETKKPLAGVKFSLPESSSFSASETDANGKFVRYFRTLPGARLLFTKEGFESSSKFVSLKPGERVTVDIEMKKATGQNLGDFVATILDDKGSPVAARVSLRNIETSELVMGSSDQSGQLTMKVPEGKYLVEIRAEGYKSMGDQIEFSRGKTVIKTFNLTAQ